MADAGRVEWFAGRKELEVWLSYIVGCGIGDIP